MIRNNFFSFQDIKAVIFDFDGTLADSEPLQCLSDYELLKQYDVPSASKTMDEYKGGSVFDRINEIRAKYCISDTLDGMISKRKSIYKDSACQRLQHYPHMRALVNKLAELEIQVAVASNTFKYCLTHLLEKIQVKGLLAAIVSAEDVKNNNTCSNVLLEAAKRMNVDEKEVLVFEDSVKGVITAKKNGMKCIAIPYDTSRINHEFMKADILYANGLKEFSVQQLFQEYN